MRKLALVVAVVACGGPPAPVVTAPVMAETRPPVEAPPVPVNLTPNRPWPTSRKDNVVDVIHGKQIADPYRWLEDEHAPDVQAWMKAQDEYTRGELGKLAGRDELEARMKQLAYYESTGAPVHRGGRYFYTRKHVDKEKTVVYWKQGEHGTEQVLFDPNAWSEDGSKGLHGWWPSYDGAYVAYAVSEHNSDETVMHVFDVAHHKELPDVIEGTKYAAASWTPDGKGFYYTWVPPVGGEVTIAERPGFAELRYHARGADPAKDPVIHEAIRDAKTFLGGGISRDGHWLTVVIQHGWSSSDVYFRDARVKNSPWTGLIVGGDAIFDIDVWRDRFYIKTNAGAPRYAVYVVDPVAISRGGERVGLFPPKEWKLVVPESSATLESMVIVGEHLALAYLDHASSRLEVRTLGGKHVRDVELPGIGTSGNISGNYDEDTGYFAFTSFTEPQIIFKTSIKTGKVDEWARVKLPIDTSNMVTEQVFYPSKDGTRISMFLIHRKDAKRDRSNPTILYGYGGFNVSMTPSFAASRIVWLEHGGLYAIPNLRGGGEYGEDWHKAGMMLAKQNVFDDFIAAAEFLDQQGWTSHDHLAIYGGSNGGLLVGAALTQRPDLYKAVICAVPLLDMLRYHLFGSGKTWVGEYGSAEDKDQFAALYAYSPYRRAIDAGPTAYPAVLFDSADHDDRVDPLHARKLAATIQALQTGSEPVLLRIERNSGHGGADMVKQQVDHVVDQLAFLMHELH